MTCKIYVTSSQVCSTLTLQVAKKLLVTISLKQDLIYMALTSDHLTDECFEDDTSWHARLLMKKCSSREVLKV